MISIITKNMVGGWDPPPPSKVGLKAVIMLRMWGYCMQTPRELITEECVLMFNLIYCTTNQNNKHNTFIYRVKFICEFVCI